MLIALYLLIAPALVAATVVIGLIVHLFAHGSWEAPEVGLLLVCGLMVTGWGFLLAEAVR